jgi:hypothetical protein
MAQDFIREIEQYDLVISLGQVLGDNVSVNVTGSDSNYSVDFPIRLD